MWNATKTNLSYFPLKFANRGTAAQADVSHELHQHHPFLPACFRGWCKTAATVLDLLMGALFAAALQARTTLLELLSMSTIMVLVPLAVSFARSTVPGPFGQSHEDTFCVRLCH